MKSYFLRVAATLLLALPMLASARDRIEAVIAPQVGLSFGHKEDHKSGSRQAFRLDFARISSGVSLNGHYGTGLDFTDFGAVLRIFDGYEISPDDLGATGIYYGLGFGAFYSPGFDKEITGTTKRLPFSDFLLNPFVRVQWDITGRFGLFVDVGYEFVPHREYWKDGSEDTDIQNRFVFAVGIPIEVER
jgi:hypothetical protein